MHPEYAGRVQTAEWQIGKAMVKVKMVKPW
jgi:hypothetical protein